MSLRQTSKKMGVLLTKKNQTLGIAESCTGGVIAAAITEIPGSSNYFYGGLVSYANRTKQELLGVSKKVLKTKGAVSKETALQMVRGARKVFKTDWSISVTGIAGPSGGTPTKPVGLVFYAVRGPKIEVVKKNVFKGNRRRIQNSAAKAALELLISLLGRI